MAMRPYTWIPVYSVYRVSGPDLRSESPAILRP